MKPKKLFKTVNENGVYSCGDIGISEAEWYVLLQDNSAQQYIDCLLCFLREPEHKSTCSNVASKYGRSAAHYNGKVMNFSKWIQKKLNRFTVQGTDGSDTYWCITMQSGWQTKQGFLWQLRDELVKALQDYLMHKLIQYYSSQEPFNGMEEEYKWALLDDVEGKDVNGIIKCLRGKNIVYNVQVDGIFKTLLETKPKELTTCIENLLDEKQALIPRIEKYRDEMRKICPSDWASCANDERTASAILTCRYPEKYTFYKSEVYQTICRYFGFEYRNAYQKFAHFIDIINDFAADYGEEIQQLMMPQIGKYKNKPLNLAIQTFFWCVREEMKSAMKFDSNNDADIEVEENVLQKEYQKYIDLLLETHNLILTGAPGTGKTYLAKNIVAQMLKVSDIKDLKDNEQYEFVQFHPSYDYTDFVEGLRPIKDENGNIGFERKDGIFKAFCARAISKYETKDFDAAYDELLESLGDEVLNLKTPKGAEYGVSVNSRGNLKLHTGLELKGQGVLTREKIKSLFAGILLDKYWGGYYEGVLDYLKSKFHLSQTKNDPNKKYVFVIDEINRGEISKIFGELFFSIDPGYRGKAGIVKTQYQNMIEEGDAFKDGFYVPENVYILATMNDIDRSVESMDFAIRRRFTWKEITPADTESMLDTLSCAKEAKETMNRLNNTIAQTDGLGVAYMIGPSYFLKLGENGGDFGKLWRMNIEPLLKEYLRGFRKADEFLTKFGKAYFGKDYSLVTDDGELMDED